MDAKHLKEFKSNPSENAYLKWMFRDLSLNHRILKILLKKALRLCGRKELVDWAIEEQGISIHRACKIICMIRSMYYNAHKKNDQTFISKLVDLVALCPTLGFQTYYVNVLLEGLFCGTGKGYFEFIGISI